MVMYRIRRKPSWLFSPASGLIRNLSLSLMVAAILFSAEFLILLLYEWAKSLRRIDDAYLVNFHGRPYSSAFIVHYLGFLCSKLGARVLA